ncbi:hypothetical protein [Xanthobacter aminoxidans]|uniref:Uncharacterized protein n=1 Tax=Xanthobacter aminoxidans TaxID=186280 RepID=A0ABW6ZA35_9HYPH
MSRRAARFTQADLARVFKAAKAAGMVVRVDLERGITDVMPPELFPQIRNDEENKPATPKRVIVM